MFWMLQMCFNAYSGYLEITVIKNIDSAGIKYFISLLQFCASGFNIEEQSISQLDFKVQEQATKVAQSWKA